MDTPQIVMIVLIAIGVSRALHNFGEKKKEDRYDIFDVLVSPALLVGLLWWGGFWS